MSNLNKSTVMLPNHSRHSNNPFRAFDEERPRLERPAVIPDQRTQFNVPTMMSVGLKGLYRRVNAGVPQSKYEDFTDSRGNLIVSDKLPLLGGRYKYIAPVGKGTFSQLVEAEDTFHPSKRHVAIKVLKLSQEQSDLAALGVLESRYINMLNSTDPLDTTHIVRTYNTFFFGDHLCIVLELLHSNLIQLIFAQRERPKAPPPPPPSLLPASTPQNVSPEPNTSTHSATPPSAKKGRASRELSDICNNNNMSDYWKPTSEKRKSRATSHDEPHTPTKKDKREQSKQSITTNIRIKADPSPSPNKRKRGKDFGEEDSALQVQQLQQQKLQQEQQKQQVEQAQAVPVEVEDDEQPLFPTWFIRSVASQLIAAVGYLYQKGMLHADLKPENIMFRDNPYVGGKFQEPYLKITDFGNAIPLSNIGMYYHDYQVQSLSYRAPEVLCGVPFGLEIDMWSIGCILAEMCNGKLLFPHQNPRELLHKMTRMFGAPPEHIYSKGKFYKEYFLQHCDICKKSPSLSFPDPFIEMKDFMRTNDYIFVDLVVQLLHYDPKKRPTPQQALQHPFFAPVFTFSIFGHTRVGTEIRRIHHSVNAKAMKIQESRDSKASKMGLKKGCILFDEDPSARDEEEENSTPLRSTAQLEYELANARSEVAKLEEGNKELNLKVFDYYVKAGNLERETSELRAEVKELSQPTSKRAAELEEENKQLREALERRGGTSGGEKAADTQRKNASALEKENKRLRDELGDLEKAKIEITIRAQAREEEDAKRVLALEEEAAAHRARVGEWNDEKVKLVNRETSALKKTSDLEKETTRLRTQMKSVNEEKTKLIARENASQRQLTTLEQECIELRRSDRERSETCRELTSKLEASDAEAERAKRGLEKQVADLKKEVRTAQGGAEKAQQDLAKAQTQNNALRARSEELDKDAQKARVDLAKLRDENAELRTSAGEVDGLKKEVAKKGKELASLKAQAEEAQKREEKEQLEKEAAVSKLQKVQKEHETTREKWRETENQMEQEKRDMKVENILAVKTIQGLRDEIGGKEIELKKVREERDSATKSVTEAQKTAAKLQKKIDKAESNAKKLDDLILEAKKEKDQLKIEEKKAKAEIQRLTKELDQRDAEVEERDKQIELKQAEKEKEKQELIERMQEVEESKKGMQAAVEESRKKNKQGESEREEMRKQIERMREESEKVKEEMARKEKEYQEREKEYNKREKEYQEREKEYKEKLEKLTSPGPLPARTSPTPISSLSPSPSLSPSLTHSPSPSLPLSSLKSPSPASISPISPPQPTTHKPKPNRPSNPLHRNSSSTSSTSSSSSSSTTTTTTSTTTTTATSHLFFQATPTSKRPITSTSSSTSSKPNLVPIDKSHKETLRDAKKLLGKSNQTVENNNDVMLFDD